ncbi:MAG: LacI family transcriptional regulator [Blastochloris sp.]|nr:LacI family transcriptional regulator [Blastochloris sp.]
MPGTPRPSLRLIAHKAGVSHTAVSLALRDDPSIPEPTRLRIKKIADKHGYRPDPMVAKVLSSLRYKREGGRVLAYVHSFPDDTWKTHLVIGRTFQGAAKRAEMLGYRVDGFGLSPKFFTPKRLHDVLQNRGIDGIILGGRQMGRGHLSFDFTPFSTVALGLSVMRPQMHRVTNHQIHALQLAFRKLRHLGNRRIGLVMPRWLDARSEYLWHGGYAICQHTTPKSLHVPFYCPEGPDKKSFMHWLTKHKVDALLLLDDNPPKWLKEEGLRVPEDIQIAYLDLPPHLHGTHSGIDQRHDFAGETAVELLLGQMYVNATGVPAIPRTIMIEGRWVEGGSTCKRHSASPHAKA